MLTNQRALKHLLEQREIQSNYDFENNYHPGQLNKVADALSRIPHDVELANLIVPHIIGVDEIQKEVLTDSWLKKIVEEMENDPSAQPKYLLHQGKLLSEKSVVIPTILHTFHDTVARGYSRIMWKNVLEKYEVRSQELCGKMNGMPTKQINSSHSSWSTLASSVSRMSLG